MSRPTSSNGRTASSAASIGEAVRRSRALTTTIASYSGISASQDRSQSRNTLSNEYKRRSLSLDRATRFDDMIAQVGGVPRNTRIRRWDGQGKTTTNWDCLHKDPELWFSNGDCLVHFYGEFDHRKGPSLRLWLADIESSSCRPLLERIICRPYKESSGSDTSDPHGRSNTQPTYDLFIPAPRGYRHEEVLNYHITTRNFFAWMFEKPLVGVQLGTVLVDLLKRLNEWRDETEAINEDEFLGYADTQGYTEFRDCPDHALALLHWSEVFRHETLWLDSFVHCTGMNELLVTSNELTNVSVTTKALITRANLDMAVRLDRASAALANFLEDDNLFNKKLRLSDGSLQHLERFRTFLQSHYVQRHGYWPPHLVKSKYGKVRPLPKHTLLSLYADFRNLYKFLVDAEADPYNLPEVTRSLVDVLNKYDEDMKFPALPHIIPHVPATDFEHQELRRSKSSIFSFKSKKLRNDGKRSAVASALTVASNIDDRKVVTSSIVREYALFERDYTLEETDRITATEARLARWLLIYALLQILISVTQAPDEVRDVDGVEYPLCAQTAGTPPWKYQKNFGKDLNKRRSRSVGSVQRVPFGTQAIDFDLMRSDVPPTTRSRTSPKGSVSGPPPQFPPPTPVVSTRNPLSKDDSISRNNGTANEVPQFPKRVSSRVSLKAKPSKIPVPVLRAVSRDFGVAQGADQEYEDEEEEQQVEEEEEGLPKRATRIYLNDFETDPLQPPSLPRKSSKRSMATGSGESAVSTPSAESDTAAHSADSTHSVESEQKSDISYFGEFPSVPTSRNPTVEPSVEPSRFYTEFQPSPVLPPSLDTSARGIHPTPLAIISPATPISPVESVVETPILQAAPRGRAINRMSNDRVRLEQSSESDTTDGSSSTEQQTSASVITTPSIYTPRSFGDRFVRVPQAEPSSPKISKALSLHQNGAIPPTPNTANSFLQPAGSVYTIAPEYPASPTSPGFTSDQRDQVKSIEILMAKAAEATRLFNEQRNLAGGLPLSPTTSNYSAHVEASGSLHELGKTRRLRLFSKNDATAQDSLSSRRGKTLAAVFAGKAKWGSPLSSPTTADIPNTPMSFVSVGSTQVAETASRPSTSQGQRKPGHTRQHSSEIAKQWKDDMKWKRGPGWDNTALELLSGQP